MLSLNSTSLSLKYERGIGNGELGVGKYERGIGNGELGVGNKKSLNFDYALCSRNPHFAITLFRGVFSCKDVGLP